MTDWMRAVKTRAGQVERSVETTVTTEYNRLEMSIEINKTVLTDNTWP